MGLGAFDYKVKYTHDPLHKYSTKAFEYGINTAVVTTIDNYVRKQRLPRVDFIKLDVEGAELDVIKGASDVITRFKLILAVSVYHKIDHIWTIPQIITDIRKDYKFCLRYYMTSIDETPDIFDEELQKDLYKFTGNTKLFSFGECILFAR